MNRLMYLIPLASFPLMALSEQRPEDSMKTDNPYVAAVLIFVVCLSVAVGLTGYFNFRRRGRIAGGVIFGILDWLVTGPICMSAGVSGALSLAIAGVSAALLTFIIIQFGARLASFFRKNRAGRSEYDPDRD
jgi:hypothetical protein